MDVDDEPIPGLGDDGRPDPAYAARLGLVPAPAGRRSAAFALDAGVWATLAIPGAIGAVILAGSVGQAGWDVASVPPGELMLPLILTGVSQGLLVVFGLVQLILHGRLGRTLGKAALGLRSVNVASFGPPGFWRVVLRVLVLWAGQFVLPLVGPAVLFSSSAWDPEQRGRSWLDRIGGCYVVDVRHGLDPFDAKALRHARRALATSAPESAPKLPSLATDRAPGEAPFIPSARSSSGVVSATGGAAAEWSPPPLGAPAQPQADAPLQPAAQAVVSAYTLVFDDGTRLGAPPFGLLGRRPEVAPGEPEATLVPLVDDGMRISKTHAAFGIDEAGFWVTDRSSRNGTVVDFPDGSTRTLAPGTRTVAPAGSRVTLGGRSFTVAVDPGR